MKEFKGDKRTKAYKEWKKNYDAKSQGLGDTVEKITKATGIKKAVKFLAGEDCGCDERKDKLNKLIPYAKPNCLDEWEFNFLHEWFNRKTSIVTLKNQRDFVKIYNRIFNAKKKISSCNTCVRQIVLDLKKIYNEYL
jgi:hypothetical protein